MTWARTAQTIGRRALVRREGRANRMLGNGRKGHAVVTGAAAAEPRRIDQ
jgi:hypothetical protein